VNGDVTSGIPWLISHPGPDGISLREAILAAESGAGPDTIEFSTDPADGLNGGTIFLDGALGELWITDSVTIDGTDTSGVPLGITIDAGGGTDGVVGNGDGFRIFNITGAGSTLVTLSGLTLTRGDVTGSGGASAWPRGDRPLALAA
jgi:hypothetical protein